MGPANIHTTILSGGTGFILDLVLYFITDSTDLLAEVFGLAIQNVYYVEDLVGSVMDSSGIDQAYAFISSLAVSLVLLKALKKGFFTYILWRDGDPDASIQNSILSMMLAVITVICFPTLYGWYADISLWIITQLGVYAGIMTSGSLLSLAVQLLIQTFLTSVLGIVNIVKAVMVLIYVVLIVILFVQLLRRSAELLLLRIGFPLACMGLLDSDNGVFTATVKVFIQTTLTTAAQIFCMLLSLNLMIKGSLNFMAIIFAIVFASAALKTPQMVQYILLQTGGGNMGYRISSTFHTVSIIKGLLGK